MSSRVIPALSPLHSPCTDKEQLSCRWYRHAADITVATWETCFPSSVEGLFWYETLEHCGLEDQFEFHYLLISDSSGPVAIAPTFLMNVPLQIMAPAELEKALNVIDRFLPKLTKIRTAFVGSPCADEGTIGIAPGTSRAAIFNTVDRAMKEHARRHRADMIVWKDFSEADAKEIAPHCQARKLLQICSYPGMELHLPGRDFAAYLSSLKKSRRQNLKRKLELSRKTGVLKARVITTPDDEQLEQMFRLFWKTYEKGTTKFEKLNIDFFREVSRKAPSRFLLLQDTAGQLVAFRLFFELDGKIINKFIGIDYDAPQQYFLLFKLVEEGINYALTKGIHVIQSGQTGYAPKFETGHTLVPLYNFLHHRNPIAQLVLKRIAPTITWDTVDAELTEYLKKYPDALPR